MIKFPKITTQRDHSSMVTLLSRHVKCLRLVPWWNRLLTPPLGEVHTTLRLRLIVVTEFPASVASSRQYIDKIEKYNH